MSVDDKDNIGQGVGTELKRLLAFVGIHPTEDCPCNEYAKIMNEQGPEWCKANKESIIDAMEAEAKNRPIVGKVFTRFAAEKLIFRAIRNWKDKAGKAALTAKTQGTAIVSAVVLKPCTGCGANK